MTDKLEKKIESILFWKAEPVEISELVKILSEDESVIKIALDNLKNNLSDRGVYVVNNGNNVCLVTSPENSEIIELLQKDELSKELSKAALETLSIILYRGPIKRSNIDYIRGVNSQFILRNLLIRGLVEKRVDKNDERAYIYCVTTDTLSYLGIQNVEELPNYMNINSDIDSFFEDNDNENN